MLISHETFGFLHSVLTIMENARCQHGVSLALLDAVGQVLQAADTARSNHRNGHRFRHRTRERQVEAAAGTVTVHAGEQDFTGAEPRHVARPLDRVQAGGVATTVGEYFPLALAGALGVNCHHDALRSVFACRIFHSCGLVTAEVLIPTLSAPALSRRRTSSTARTPPPTVSGMKTCEATASMMSSSKPRPSDEAVMSRKVISSAPCSS